jgi:hypothetical protein
MSSKLCFVCTLSLLAPTYASPPSPFIKVEASAARFASRQLPAAAPVTAMNNRGDAQVRSRRIEVAEEGIAGKDGGVRGSNLPTSAAVASTPAKEIAAYVRRALHDSGVIFHEFDRLLFVNPSPISLIFYV